MNINPNRTKRSGQFAKARAVIRAGGKRCHGNFTIAPDVARSLLVAPNYHTMGKDDMGIVRCGWKLQALRTMPMAAGVQLGDSKQPRGKGGHLFFTCFLQAIGAQGSKFRRGGRKSTLNAARCPESKTISASRKSAPWQFTIAPDDRRQSPSGRLKQPREKGGHLFFTCSLQAMACGIRPISRVLRIRLVPDAIFGSSLATATRNVRRR